MKVEYEIKITILEGEEKGNIIQKKGIGETKTTYTSFGIVERLMLEWSFIHHGKHTGVRE